MFAGHEVLLEVSFAVARERLVQLTEGGSLISASEDAYDRGTASPTMKMSTVPASRQARSVGELAG